MITKDEEGHHKIFKEVVQQKYITLVNIFAHNKAAPKYIRKILEDSNKEF